MKRRDFAATVAGTAAFGLANANANAAPASVDRRGSGAEEGKRFRTKFAPYPGLFRHHAGCDYLDQLRFAADAGFTAWQDLGLLGRSVSFQDAVGQVLADRGITMGPALGFASYRAAPFANPDKDSRRMLRTRMRAIVEFAKRTQAKWVHVVPGRTGGSLSYERENANVADTLKMCAEILEPAGVVMLLDARRGWRSYPKCLLTNYMHAMEVCEAVDSPSCKRIGVLWDIQFRREFDSTISPRDWEANAYYEVGDIPQLRGPDHCASRYVETFEHLHKKGFQGVIGMEHGVAPEGKGEERALIDAYRQADAF